MIVQRCVTRIATDTLITRSPRSTRNKKKKITRGPNVSRNRATAVGDRSPSYVPSTHHNVLPGCHLRPRQSTKGARQWLSGASPNLKCEHRIVNKTNRLVGVRALRDWPLHKPGYRNALRQLPYWLGLIRPTTRTLGRASKPHARRNRWRARVEKMRNADCRGARQVCFWRSPADRCGDRQTSILANGVTIGLPLVIGVYGERRR
jgi:hypothetical protein